MLHDTTGRLTMNGVVLESGSELVGRRLVESGFVAISGVVDTSSTSSGCPRPKIDWEKKVWVEVRHRIEELGKVPGNRLRLGGLNNVPRRCDRYALRR